MVRTHADYIMGGPIGYSSTDTGTRQPVVILLRPSDSGRVECKLRGEAIDVKELQHKMKDIMASQGENISSQELDVELAVPNGQPSQADVVFFLLLLHFLLLLFLLLLLLLQQLAVVNSHALCAVSLWISSPSVVCYLLFLSNAIDDCSLCMCRMSLCGVCLGVHAVFVDLPGIKDDSKAGAQLTRSVVRSYVQNNPNDLYILVKKASDDPANWPWSLREFILSPLPKGTNKTRQRGRLPSPVPLAADVVLQEY